MANINQKVQAAQKQAVAGGATVASGPPQKGKVGAGLAEIDRDFIEKETLSKARALGVSYINVAKTPINPVIHYRK